MAEKIQEIKASEHDYASFIIKNAMEADDEGQPHIIYQVAELSQNNFMETPAEVENDPLTETYELVADPGNFRPLSKKPRYRRETSAASSGYWSEADVHRLLKIYLHHVKAAPELRGKPSHYLWNAIIRDFDSQKKFANIQVKSKIQRLKNVAKAIQQSGQGVSTKWPFWKPLSEILQMEKTNSEDSGETKAESHNSNPWTEEEAQTLLNMYKKHLKSMVDANNNLERRMVWARIAQALHRPRYQVKLKFQALKAKWRRWRKAGVDRSYSPNFLGTFNKIATAEKIARKQKLTTAKVSEATPEKDGPFKWKHDGTMALLSKYQELLEDKRDSGCISTRAAIYHQVAANLNVPWRAVQIKICSLKGHYRKFKNMQQKGRKKSWPYLKIMGLIVKLENILWKYVPDEFHNQGGNSGDESQTTQVNGRRENSKREDTTKNELTYKEPSWFREYRREVEKRQRDRVQILERLLTVIKKIAEK